MIEVRVCRGGAVYNPPRCELDDSALKWGAEISDPVLCTVEAAEERGRVSVDEEYVNRLDTTIKLHTQQFVQPGSLVSVTNGVSSDNGMLNTITIDYARAEDAITYQSVLNTEMLA